MQIPRLRYVLVLKNSLIPSTCTPNAFASFHSTPASCEKWKDKWDFDETSSPQQPSKHFIRYSTRHKQPDAKKALKNLLFNSGCSPKISYEHIQEDDSGISPKNQRSKSCRVGQKSHHKKMKRKLKRESFSDDENHPETIFQATYGKRWFTWSFNSQRCSSFHDSASEFDWRDPSSWKDRRKRWENSSDEESDDEQCTIGSCSDRNILGLPSTGPLKTEDVKKAFHISALKWHPDKHQGPSQEVAAEKFKLCVNAYKSLCNASSAA